ncbi:hypothetical protein CC86DRAFT_106527 [Ophiobolus disseminans]|uniref:Uncharacterized protein n=1 Tax=Ophiobolus disseminans TaxID=1469910 RepID=A0A6A6ZLF0_9PLEO|nr:hypothetical protein CC86DRAFT_106527 [Ophiobolus disseminans]
MAGTIITIFRWSILRAGSFALILLWAFNPLGSQASFRGAYLWSNLGESQGFITYHNPNVSIQAHLSPFGFVGVARSTIRALFSSAMYDPIASTQYVDPTRNATRDIVNMLGGDSSTAIYGAMDSWNNVRIPSLEDHPNYSASDTHRWLVNAWLEKRTNYSSLIGDRVLGINRSFVGNTSFTMSSSYQKYNCIPWINLNTTTSIFDNGTTLNDSIADVWLEERTKWNLPQHTQGGNRKWFLWLDWDVFTRTPADPPLLFASRNTREDNLAVTECKARTTYIDVNVTCISKGSIGKSNCGVDAMRESQNPPASSSKTPLNEVSKGDLAMGEFMEMLNDPTYSSSSHLEYYLADPLTANQKGNYGRDQARLGDVDIRLFERRWSLVWNTFWKTAWSYGSTMGAELTLSTTVQTFDNTTSFVTYPLPPVYTIDRPWLATYFIAVSIMLAAAVFALVMRALCRAPVLLGYVSSLTRDSVFFTDADHKSTTEDGPQRSKRLGKMCVMVADVGGGGSKEGVGRIAFAPAEMGRGRRVEKGRWYD